MNNKQQRLADKCANIIPLEGRILVVANKLRTFKDVGLTSKPVDPDVSDDAVIQGETEMVLEEIETDVNYRYQTAVVLKVDEDEKRFDIGDTIIYPIGLLQDFDFVKGTSVLRKYDVVGVVK